MYHHGEVRSRIADIWRTYMKAAGVDGYHGSCITNLHDASSYKTRAGLRMASFREHYRGDHQTCILHSTRLIYRTNWATMACCEADQGWDALYDEVDGMHKYRGVISLPCMTTKLLDDLMDNFKFREDDVLMVSYPQSNFMWVQEAMYHMFHQDTLDVPIKEKDALAMRVPFLEHEFRNVEPMSLLENTTGTRLMKSHFSHHLLEKQLGENINKTRIILWVQDPKDVVINYHDFWTEKGDYFDFPLVDWEKFYDLYKNNALFEGEWVQMNSSWLKAMDGKDNFLMLRYEDAAKDMEGTVRKISKFLGVKANGFKVSRIAHMQPFDKKREWKGRWTEEQQKFADERYREGMKGTCLEGHYVK